MRHDAVIALGSVRCAASECRLGHSARSRCTYALDAAVDSPSAPDAATATDAFDPRPRLRCRPRRIVLFKRLTAMQVEWIRPRSPQHAFRIPAVIALLVMMQGGCLERPGVQCANGAWCTVGLACDDVHGACVDPEQITVCRMKSELAPCHYRSIPNGSCIEGICLPRGCGNGQLEEGEICDDGNNNEKDGCSADCRSKETCGNQIIDDARGEACDDGNTIDGDGCQANCKLPACGDGILDTQHHEQCDCGTDRERPLPTGCKSINDDTPDGTCRANCQRQRCGDGVRDSNELCDDGNVRSGDGCSGDCLREAWRTTPGSGMERTGNNRRHAPRHPHEMSTRSPTTPSALALSSSAVQVPEESWRTPGSGMERTGHSGSPSPCRLHDIATL